MVSISLLFLIAKWEKGSNSSSLFSKAPSQCNEPAGIQTTSPGTNSIILDKDEPPEDEFIVAFLPSLLTSILSTRTTIHFPLIATSVCSVACMCGLVLHPFLNLHSIIPVPLMCLRQLPRVYQSRHL